MKYLLGVWVILKRIKENHKNPSQSFGTMCLFCYCQQSDWKISSTIFLPTPEHVLINIKTFEKKDTAYAKKHLCTTNTTGNPEEPAKTSIPKKPIWFLILRRNSIFHIDL